MRFIAVNDGVDSARGDNDFIPVRNLFNDFYAKDTSRKVRAAIKAKGISGKHLNQPMYGYREEPDNKGIWLIDEETAPVVKRMLDLTIAGKGTQQNAEILEAEKTLNPAAVKDLRRGKTPRNEPCRWNNNTVRMILRHKEYAGYIGIEELTPTIVNECVQKIIVHEADTSTGKRVQQIEIIFNFIGGIDLPAATQPVTIT